ncbi:plasmid related protein [Chitinimonas sp. DQS-5]|uniref:Plasmid related protein n=1 Tax=Parachitinimonas caeni TaxID=3031301 RepID=A0ABT7E367_9NEIS|nr:plasmid related protein [Parachitinimonas caeni]
MTCGVDEALQCGAIKMHWLADCIRRHARGDWGSVPKSDAALNLAALTPGDEGRLMSVYPLPTAVDGETTIWIITEWDRSVTTILLPSEY